MEQKLALLITAKIIYTLSKALPLSFFCGWYRQRCQRCLTAFIPTLIKLEQVLAPDRNKWYKVRPEDFFFTSVHLAPKMLYAICSYPWSKHSVSDTHAQSMTQPYSSSTAAAFSQHRQNSSSCSRGQTPRCILSLPLIYPRVQLQQQRRRLRAFFSVHCKIQ